MYSDPDPDALHGFPQETVADFTGFPAASSESMTVVP